MPGLDPTYSTAEVAAHLGITRGSVWVLRKLGDQFGRELHPSRGGLWPSFSSGARTRRYPLAAVERHKSHLARLGSEVSFLSRQIERAERLGYENCTAQLYARLRRLKSANLSAA